MSIKIGSDTALKVMLKDGQPETYYYTYKYIGNSYPGVAENVYFDPEGSSCSSAGKVRLWNLQGDTRYYECRLDTFIPKSDLEINSIVDDVTGDVLHHRCKISFNSNGGTPSIPQRIKTAGVEAIGTIPTVTRPGYIFLGWRTTDGIQFTSNSYAPYEDIVLTAAWSIEL